MPAAVVNYTSDIELAASITVDYPASLVTGNTLVLVSGRGNNSVTTAPTGFTERADASALFSSLTVWTRVIDGTESGAVTIGFDTSRQQVAYMLQVNGTFDVAAVETGGASAVAPTVTATAAGLLLSVVTSKDTTAPLTTFTAPAGMTLVDQRDDGGQQATAVASETVTSGATGTRTWGFVDGGALRAANIVLSDLVATDVTGPVVSLATIHGTGQVADIYDSADYNPATDELTVTVTATDAESAITAVEVNVDGGGWVAATFDAGDDWTYAIDVSGWATGDHTVDARATSTGGTTTVGAVTVRHNPSGIYLRAETATDSCPPAVVEIR